jgi:GntR family histidine utilization transcriptional repressor
VSTPARSSWEDIRTEVLRRLNTRVWKPGDLIPGETELAREFGCARATVNRALRALAEDGLLDRKRRAGTRVALRPVRRASFAIPVLREEIEGRGLTYGYVLLKMETAPAPAEIGAAMRLGAEARLLHVTSVHLGDDRPFVFEDRWINPSAAPGVAAAPLERVSANEWLLMHTPYSHGDIAFTADAVREAEAEALAVAPGQPGFVIERTTWNLERPVTTVRQVFAPGYRLRTEL